MKINLKTTKWDLRFLDRAATISQWSKDPSTKVGATISKINRPISEGFNGLPQRLPSRIEGRYLMHRDIKWKHIIHSEMNAIIFAKQDLTGSTLHTWPFLPCTVCASLVAQAGIVRVVSSSCEREWCAESAHFLKECGVVITLYNPLYIIDYIEEFGLSFRNYIDFIDSAS